MKRRLSRIAPFLCILSCLLCPLLAPRACLAEETSPRNGIPVLSITIDGGDEEFQKMNTSEGHTYDCTGTMSLEVPEGYTDACGLTSPSSFANLKLDYMRGRGNSTWNASGGRNPYKLKLHKKADLLGTGANKHWVLLASSIDSSGLRNRLVQYMGTQLGLDYTPVGTHVDLVVNGSYRGSYYLGEQVRIDESRVKIDELTADDVTEPEVTGGYLISMAPKNDEPEGNRITTQRGVQFCGDNPLFASANPDDELGASEQKEWIANYLQQTEDAIWNLDSWSDYMDGTSAAKYWWVQQFTQNTDAFITPSTYLYKPRGDKLYWGPLWDFDQSMGSQGGNGMTGFSSRMEWIDFLRTYDPAFKQELRDAWSTYDSILQDIEREGGVLDAIADEVRASWQADFDLWVADTVIGQYAKTFDQEVEDIRSWISNSRSWIYNNIETELNNAYRKVDFEYDGAVVETKYVHTGQYLYTLASPPQQEGKVFVGWGKADGSLVEEVLKVDEDITLVAQYLNEDEAVMGKNLYLNLYEAWMGPNATYTIKHTVVPDNAHEKYPTWTSSDPSVAEVDGYGNVTPHQPGTTTITGTLASSAAASCVIHVAQSPNELSIDANTMKVELSSLSLAPGEYGQVRVSIEPQPNADVAPAYSVENDEIATVDENGVVKALAPGTTVVHLSDPNDPDKVYTSFTVVVTKPEQGSEQGSTPQPDPEQSTKDNSKSTATPHSSSNTGSEKATEGNTSQKSAGTTTATTSTSAAQNAKTSSTSPTTTPKTGDKSHPEAMLLAILAALVFGTVTVPCLHRR